MVRLGWGNRSADAVNSENEDIIPRRLCVQPNCVIFFTIVIGQVLIQFPTSGDIEVCGLDPKDQTARKFLHFQKKRRKAAVCS